MRTELCENLGIEYPIFAFSHCRNVGRIRRGLSYAPVSHFAHFDLDSPQAMRL
jgi:hypothetical protein